RRRQTMSSSPECKSCGDYIHGGLVICEGCISKRLTTARESAAREMRERCVKEAKTHEETARELLNRAKADGNDRLADNHEGAADAAEEIADALSALPLTPTKEPADG